MHQVERLRKKLDSIRGALQSSMKPGIEAAKTMIDRVERKFSIEPNAWWTIREHPAKRALLALYYAEAVPKPP
jgi:hypothetical protein